MFRKSNKNNRMSEFTEFEVLDRFEIISFLLIARLKLD